MSQFRRVIRALTAVGGGILEGVAVALCTPRMQRELEPIATRLVSLSSSSLPPILLSLTTSPSLLALKYV